MLLFKDSIRLFAAYNEGIINLLGMWDFFLSIWTFVRDIQRTTEYRQYLTAIS